jgi:hypothetical protein
MSTPDYDSPWKEILDGYFPDFMAFFFADIHADIDWSRGYESLDAELQQIVRDAVLGRRLADKLMQVWRHDGTPQMVLIHLEVQGQREADFPKRMFVYNYRTFDRYDCPVASLAVLTDASRAWRPTRYRYRLWGCEMGIRFRVVKLRDYRTRWAELEGSRNPFAVVVMAHLQARAMQRHPTTRLQAKVQLIRHLYTQGLTRQQILDLFRFLDWVLTLPEALEQQFQVELAHVEAETHMPYITSIERMGIEKGIQEGLQQGFQQGEAFVLTRLLTRRFGPLPGWASERLAQASREDLEQWAERVLDAQRLEDVFATT